MSIPQDILLRRYEWEDCLIESAALKLIPKGWTNSGLRLSRQFNWTPKKTQKPPGLYWANTLAAKSVGIGESTFYAHTKGLKSVGFLTVQHGNLIPRLPDNHGEVEALFTAYVRSLAVEHDEKREANSRSNGENSRIEILKSLDHGTFTEDLCTEDLCTEDLCTEDLFPQNDASHPARAGGTVEGQKEDGFLKKRLTLLGVLPRRIASRTRIAAIKGGML